MKQILQNLRTGLTRLEDVASPGLKPGAVIIRTRSSLVSAETERNLVEFLALIIAWAISAPIDAGFGIRDPG
jgi:hypothetical protein